MSTPEEWRLVPGFPDYEVSSQGRVWSWRKWRGTTGRLLAGRVHPNGYRMVDLSDGSGKRRFPVHHLVAAVFHGVRPDGADIRHLDGNKLNNRADNLCYGSRSENVLDLVRHGVHNNARKTHCPSGHPYDETNTYLNPPTGSRLCRACRAGGRKRVAA